ncbi:transposase [Flammeovirgaceae bacterium 311]|nr:transposase [Flammeovirgaceae bacterium 311]
MGICNIFLVYYMDKRMRYCKVTERRTKADFALFVDELLREQHPEAKRVTIVLDNRCGGPAKYPRL